MTRILDPFFIMTVDVDSWSSLLGFYSVRYEENTADEQIAVEEGLENLLDLFGFHEIQATFFVPGTVCLKHERSIRKICDLGHEVGCHGLIHEKTEFLVSQSEQEQKIMKASRILEETCGSRPVGFRAPVLKITHSTIAALSNSGYLYDSSVVPTSVPGYYGYLNAPMKPYYPSCQSMSKMGESQILEIPVSVNPLVHLPLSAAWMRNLGYLWVKTGIDMNLKRGNPIVFYVHPRDVVTLPTGAPWHVYRNTGRKGFGILDKIIRHVKKSGVRFMNASSYAKMFKEAHLQ